MNLAVRLLVTLIFAAIGGMIGIKLKMPAGALTGALIVVVIFNIVTGVGYVPDNLRSFVQMFTGALIGSRIKRSDIHELRLVIWPTIFLLIGMVIYNFLFGIMILKLSHFDIYTAFLSVAPGGMTDMPLIAADLGGDQVIVALMQLLRMIFIFVVFPQLYRKIGQKELGCAEPHKEEAREHAQAAQPKDPIVDKTRIKELLLTSIVGLFGGTVLWLLDITAGARRLDRQGLFSAAVPPGHPDLRRRLFRLTDHGREPSLAKKYVFAADPDVRRHIRLRLRLRRDHEADFKAQPPDLPVRLHARRHPGNDPARRRDGERRA